MYSIKVEVYILYINHKIRILLTVKQTVSLLTKCVLDKKTCYPKDRTIIHVTRMRCSQNWDAWNKGIENLSKIRVKLKVS